LPILGPNHEDEDGDNESHSPSTYLNLNQDENEEGATNAKHEGDENEEDEGNVEQALVDTLSASQVRCGRGPNKLPSRRFVITEVNEAGDPTQPPVSVNAWETSVGKLVRENVPDTYRFWKGKKYEQKYIIPDSIKQNLWDTLMAKFELPKDCNTGLVKSRTLSSLGLSFRNFKSRLRSQYGQKDKMPDWDENPLLKPYWSGFKKYKQSEEATKISQENKMNMKNKVIDHTTGYCGYAQKDDTWQEQEEKAIQSGALVLHNPSGHRSSCASTTAIENDDNRYPIDDLEERKEYSFVTPVLGIPRIVAYGLARPFIEGTLFNSHPIPKGHAIVLVHRVKPDHRRSKLEYPGENGEWKLGMNIGCHVLWRN
jgi:hypothetical protein